MTDIARPPGAGRGNDLDVDNVGGRLGAYQDRSRAALDLLALVTLWFAVVPPWTYAAPVRGIVWVLRIALSAVYGVDLVIRGVLAGHPAHYARAHPLALASVILPPVRVAFSLRVARAMFRRGRLVRFLLVAAVLVLNGAIIVYLFERNAPEANIHTLGQSVWWALVTVTTVGYGDYFPVTTQGRITAGFIMLTGLLTLAVVTAQVASSFIAQQPGRARRPQDTDPGPSETTMADLDRRLARIEQLLALPTPSPTATVDAPKPGTETS